MRRCCSRSRNRVPDTGTSRARPVPIRKGWTGRRDYWAKFAEIRNAGRELIRITREPRHVQDLLRRTHVSQDTDLRPSDPLQKREELCNNDSVISSCLETRV